MFLPKELLDRMAHDVGFDGGFRYRLDAEPRLIARGVANIFHASSTISGKQAGTAEGTWQAPVFRRAQCSESANRRCIQSTTDLLRFGWDIIIFAFRNLS